MDKNCERLRNPPVLSLGDIKKFLARAHTFTALGFEGIEMLYVRFTEEGKNQKSNCIIPLGSASNECGWHQHFRGKKLCCGSEGNRFAVYYMERIREPAMATMRVTKDILREGEEQMNTSSSFGLS